MNAQIAKEIDAGMKNIKGRPEAAFKLGYGSLGNGITVWNSAKEVNGDYEKVAHINPLRKITYYIENLPVKIIAYIEGIANGPNPSVSTSQPEQKVFHDPAPKITVFNKVLLDSKIYDSIEDMRRKNFCGLHLAAQIASAIKEDGVFENEFYTIKEV